ncbi:MAG: hypothetical protein WAX85_01825 [Minisyncoccia bacterium]
MDNQQEIPEYIKNLPKPVQDVVLDGVWESRTTEIAKKYALNPIQTDGLINSVLFILIGLDKPDDFLERIINDLGISSLLAEQILEDVNNRVFEYAIKEIGGKSKSELAQNIPSSVPIQSKTVEGRVEIRPENLPSKNITTTQEKPPAPKYVPTYKPTATVLNDPSLHHELPKVAPEPSRIIYKPNASSEPIQQPIPVPRFVPKPVTDMSAQTGTLTVQTSKPLETVALAKTEQKEKPPERYTIDPYREPIE